jgi:hypothetical protein
MMGPKTKPSPPDINTPRLNYPSGKADNFKHRCLLNLSGRVTTAYCFGTPAASITAL